MAHTVWVIPKSDRESVTLFLWKIKWYFEQMPCWTPNMLDIFHNDKSPNCVFSRALGLYWEKNYVFENKLFFKSRVGGSKKDFYSLIHVVDDSFFSSNEIGKQIPDIFSVFDIQSLLEFWKPLPKPWLKWCSQISMIENRFDISLNDILECFTGGWLFYPEPSVIINISL